MKIGYLPQNFELTDNPNGKLFVGSARKIIDDVRELDGLGVSFIALGFFRENMEKTVVYTEKFANEVLSRL